MRTNFYIALSFISVMILSSFAEVLPAPSSEEFLPARSAAPSKEWGRIADSLQKSTYKTFIGSDGVFNQDNQGTERFNYWWNAHMVDALVDGYLRTGDEAYFPKIKALVRGIKKKNNGSYQIFYNDDMQWLGIACLRAYEATGDKEYKEVADFLWNEVKKGWSEVHGGGIMWRTDTPEEKNACSNGPGALLALRMYKTDGNKDDLDWAKKIYEWEKNTLVDPLTGLVWDNISNKNGTTEINKELVLSYNQGTYIGAATELYEITGEEIYLHDAWKTTNSLMTSPKLTFEGILKNEKQGDRGLFKGILVRYLTILAENPNLEEGKRNDLTDFLTHNANILNTYGIDNQSWLVGPDWAQKPEARVDFSTQLSGLMLAEMAARLDLSQKRPVKACEDTGSLSAAANAAVGGNINKDLVIVVLGSSTAEGIGPSKKENGWVSLFSEHLTKNNPGVKVVNLAQGGFQTTDLLPSGHPEKNITKALSYSPDAIIINLPSNDAEQERAAEEQLENYQTILSKVSGKDIPVWITTPQPRNFGPSKVYIQNEMVDDTYAAFEEPFVIDFWTCFADEKGHIKKKFDSGDGIHLNDAAHQLLFNRVVSENIPEYLQK